MRVTCGEPLCVNVAHCKPMTPAEIGRECAASWSHPVRHARIAAAVRAGQHTKLSQDDARAIRASDEPCAVLAALYGVHKSTVSKIRRGELRREFVGNVWAGLA